MSFAYEYWVQPTNCTHTAIVGAQRGRKSRHCHGTRNTILVQSLNMATLPHATKERIWPLHEVSQDKLAVKLLTEMQERYSFADPEEVMMDLPYCSDQCSFKADG